MGRHGAPAPRPAVPWELVGWGAFACLVAAVTVVLTGGSWLLALLILLAGVLGIGAVALVAATGSSRPRRPPHP